MQVMRLVMPFTYLVPVYVNGMRIVLIYLPYVFLTCVWGFLQHCDEGAENDYRI